MIDPLLRLRLARARGVGPRNARALEELCGLERLFSSEPLPENVSERIARALRCPQLKQAAAQEWDLIAELGYELLARDGAGYPACLNAIHDPPQTLCVWGELPDQPAVAVVGARRATHEGRELAYQLAAELAEAGVTVVSGLARGIDTAAHRGALDAGGLTVAFLGCGLRRIREPARPLAARIARNGAVVSELHPDDPPRRHTFPQRNRLIVGLSEGVVVVQAGPRSGALITAELALSEGRELFAVPGSPREPLSRGPNGLIRDGAQLVETARDVLDPILGLEREEEPSPAEQRVLESLSSAPQRLEPLAARSGLPLEQVMRALGRLELAGQVRSLPDGRWALSPDGREGKSWAHPALTGS